MAYFLADGTFVIENDIQPIWKNYSKHHSMQHHNEKNFTVCSENYNQNKPNVRMEMIPKRETRMEMIPIKETRMEMVPRKEVRMEMVPRKEARMEMLPRMESKPKAETKYATVEFKSSRKPIA